jgi:hypothetical protein
MDCHQNEFHQFECGFVDNPKDPDMDFGGLKMLLHTLAPFNFNPNALRKFFRSIKKKKTVFDFDLSDKSDPMYEKNMILAELGLYSDTIDQAVIESRIGLIHEFIEKHPRLRQLWSSPLIADFLNRLLFRFLKLMMFLRLAKRPSSIKLNLDGSGNQLETENEIRSTNIEKIDSNFLNCIALYLDPYIDLLSHSCVPSVGIGLINNKNVWIVKHPVKAGDQICINYLEFPILAITKNERNELLQELHRFTCSCEACRLDYPQPSNMKLSKEIPGRSGTFPLEVLKIENQNIGVFLASAGVIDARWHKFPCYEVWLMQQWLTGKFLASISVPAPWFYDEDFDQDSEIILSLLGILKENLICRRS